jgi:glutamate-1-semialdehyde 2,1-aminomutase
MIFITIHSLTIYQIFLKIHSILFFFHVKYCSRMIIDHEKLKADLYERYTKKYRRSGELQNRAEQVLIDGGSHAIRLIGPFPPRIKQAEGAYIVTEENERILDFWQGHHANILGHNPPLITEHLAKLFQERGGLQTGFVDALQAETAEIFCERTGLDMVRFTTSGSLATMYAVLLARAYTGRELVMKEGGGWHGAQPWGLKGIEFHHSGGAYFDEIDTKGLPEIFGDEIIITHFNDAAMLEGQFKKYGDRIACLILEPFIGAGGFIAADREYIERARELTRRYGAVLIFDEVIAGFRFCAGSIGKHYGVTPDLGAYGKIMGGGMPISAVGGGREIMQLAGRGGGRAVRFSGGTYSAHPASLAAANRMMRYLAENEKEIYPRIGSLGGKCRRAAERAFREHGIYAVCTGGPGDALPGSSLGMLFFPREEGYAVATPAETRDPHVCDTVLGEELLQIALLLENVHVVHGLGSVSTAHTEEDIDRFYRACLRAAEYIKGFVK